MLTSQSIHPFTQKRNTAFSRALELGTQHSKALAQINKKKRSSSVKNDLISVQDKIKDRDMQRISTISSRQRELKQLVDKNEKEKGKYEKTL